jgi:NodT family efflux transporter outer membrane factor (OMF) lipoprotein
MKHRLVTLLILSPLLSACAVGPNYVRPEVDAPASFRETQGWKPAQPADTLPRGKWWELFGVAELNALTEQVEVSNQNLRAAEARYRQSQALTRSARAGLFPTLSASASTGRSRQRGAEETSKSHSASLSANWEADIWGKLRRDLESTRAASQASAADMASLKLSLQAELAANYFALRVNDAQRELLEDSITAFDKSMELTNNRYKAGVASRADLVQAEAQLRSTQAQALDLDVQRAQLEHAIAVLIGKTPSTFSLPRKSVAIALPAIPAGLPSTLLERRPDIAAAERRVASANADIGVARAAWFPALTFSAQGGYSSPTLTDWISAPNRFWSLGPQLALTLLDFGRRGAVVDSAVAGYDASVADYRQTVLEAFAEVEDNLAALRILTEEAKVQAEAVRAARESVALTTNQYKAGTVSYLNVVTVQTTQLSNERSALSLLGRQLNAAVSLVRALGGGWRASDLPAS